jgi:oligopeptide/dipeptide ABC transporter ATP-binding protein
VLILDEPVSALDVSVRAEVMNLLVRLRQELGLSYVFISHDLSMVRHISTRIAVMYLGRIVEIGPWDVVLDEPLHPYTRALRDTMPVPDPELAAHQIDVPVRGEVPNPVAPPSGCPFHPRCPRAEPACADSRPALLELLPGHLAACHVARRELADQAVETGAVTGESRLDGGAASARIPPQPGYNEGRHRGEYRSRCRAFPIRRDEEAVMAQTHEVGPGGTTISIDERREKLDSLIAQKLQEGYWIETQSEIQAVLVLGGGRRWLVGPRQEDHREAVSVDVEGHVEVLVLPKRRY